MAIVNIKGKSTRRAVNLLYPLEAEPPWQGLPRLSATPSSSQRSDNEDNDSIVGEDVNPDEIPTDRRGRPINRPRGYEDYWMF